MSVFLQANVWFPRPSAAEIAALTSPETRAWAPEDIGDAISGTGALINPMTTTGDMIYATNTATPATPGRLGAGAVGTFLGGNGAGVAPSWQPVTGFTAYNGLPLLAWGHAFPGSSTTNITTTGSLARATPTATDNTSNVGIANVWGPLGFRQSTSAVANNTTVLNFTSVNGPISAVRGNPIWAYTFGFDGSNAVYFAFNFGGNGGAPGVVATENPHSVGLSFLSGDTGVHAFSRAGGAGVTRSADLTAGNLAADTMYTMVVDFSDFNTSVRVLLYNWTTATWVIDYTLTTTLPTAYSANTVCLYQETTGAAARTIYHFGLSVVNATTYPLSLP